VIRSSRMLYWVISIVLPILVMGAVIGLWYAAVKVFSIPRYVVPLPIDIWNALAAMRTELMYSTGRTAVAAIGGLAVSSLLGTTTAFVFAQSVIIRRAFYPYAILLQTVPVIAIAPLIILTFGRGFQSVTLVAVVISVFPVITSTTTGLLQIDRQLMDLFRLHRATWWQKFWKLRFPSALPWIISGIRIASGVAVVGAIVGEFFVGTSQPGLGALIQRKTASLNLPELYATVIASVVLGVVTFALITVVGDFILRRWFGRRLDGAF
jgi:NitT/TauT family transport system permease protein